MASGSEPIRAETKRTISWRRCRKRKKRTKEGDSEEDVPEALVGPVRVPGVEKRRDHGPRVDEGSHAVGLDRGLEADTDKDGREKGGCAGDWKKRGFSQKSSQNLAIDVLGMTMNIMAKKKR